MNQRSTYFVMLLAVIVAGFTVPASAEVTFEWVTVGNPGNAADPLNSGSIPGIGSVGYAWGTCGSGTKPPLIIQFA